MAENVQNAQKEFQKFCEGMDCASMMRKMMEAKKAGPPFNCAEMMAQMMKMFQGARKEEAGAPPKGEKE